MDGPVARVQDSGRLEATRLLRPIWRRLFAIWFVIAGSLLAFAGPEYPVDVFRAFAIGLGVIDIFLAGGVVYAYNKVQRHLPEDKQQDSVAKLLPKHIFFLGVSHIGMMIALIGHMFELWNEPFNVFVLPFALFSFLTATIGLSFMWVFQVAKESRILVNRGGVEVAHPHRRKTDTGL